MKLTPENNWLCLYCSDWEPANIHSSSLKDIEKPAITPDVSTKEKSDPSPQTAKLSQARIDQLNKQYADDLDLGKEEKRRSDYQVKKVNEPKRKIKNTDQLSGSVQPAKNTKSINTITKNMHYSVEYIDSGWVRNFNAVGWFFIIAGSLIAITMAISTSDPIDAAVVISLCFFITGSFRFSAHLLRALEANTHYAKISAECMKEISVKLKT